MKDGYQPQIDGLRAIAVTAVILFHGQVVSLPGGFAGVDVFFVLSGFLITGILLQELASGTFTITGFYERRIRRIFPALFVVLACTSVAAWMTLPPPQLEAFAKSLLAVVLFLSNFVFAANSGYFSPALEEAPLLHTWSLSVEEQYYLLFPLVLLVLFAKLRPFLAIILGGMAVLSLGLAVWGVQTMPQQAFFFPLTRAWELLVGAMLALWRFEKGMPAPRSDLSTLGMLAVLGAFVLHSEAQLYPGLAALLPVAGTAAIIMFAGTTTPVGRLLASRPFVAIGLISYSAYLWHQPLFALTRATLEEPPGKPVMAVLTGLTFLLAWFSWRWVEQPFRRPAERKAVGQKHLFWMAGGGTIAFLVIGAVGLLTEGNNAAWRAAHPARAGQLDLILAAQFGHGQPADAGQCRFNMTQIDAAAIARISDCVSLYGPVPVVLGDSHAIDLFSALQGQATGPSLIGVTSGGCRPTEPDGCAYKAFADYLLSHPGQVGSVLFVQSGAYMLRGADGRAGDRQLFRRMPAQKRVSGISVDDAAVEAVANYLAELNSLVPVTWLASRTEPHIAPNQVLRARCDDVVALRPGLEALFDELDQVAFTAAKARAIGYLGLSVLDYDHTQDFMTCDALFWSDGDHWSEAGEARFGARLLPHLTAVFPGDATQP
jgi:peptidoglycan/LPS O-acetylase OafA/YrhL